MNNKYPLLMKPGKMGRLELENRIVSAPMGTLNGDKDGFVTDRAIQYYIEEAKGGYGLIVVESTYIDTLLSKAEDNELGLWSNEHITGFARLVSCIHDHGVKAVLQFNHIGHQLSLADHCESLGPSETTVMMGGVYPFPIRGITKEEMAQVVEDFAMCSWRAKMAGFDGVQIHGAIGHLIAMFSTPFYNKRTDEYGGSPENRIRFMVDIVKAVQEKCGHNFPIIARVTGCEFDDDGLTLEDGIIQAKILEKAGVAAFHIVGGSMRNVLCINSQYDPRGDFIPIAAGFKKAGIKTPIILDGGFTTPDIAEKALADGITDFIGLGRPTLADAQWPNKIKEGRPEDIVPCIRCCVGCVGSMAQFNAAKGLRCSVNPRCNLAGYREVAPLIKKKKVCIIGGGPAGMEAARLASERGHEVTLYEKRKLGGTMHEAAFDLSIKGDIQLLIDYYNMQMEKMHILIKHEEATAEAVLNGNYDAVIVATGAPPIKSKLHGLDKPHVYSIMDYNGDRNIELGQTVLVVGGCFFNTEIALSLAKKGKTVILSTRRGGDNGMLEIGADNSSPLQQRILVLTTGQYPVDYQLCMNLVEITDDGAILEDTESKEKTEIKCDNVLVCRGYSGESALYKALQGKVKELYRVGDCQMKSRCTEVRTIGDAIHEGWVIANRL